MKTLTVILSLGLTVNSYAQEASSQWVKNSFWQAPQVKNVAVQLTSLDKDLVKTCADYRSLVANTIKMQLPTTAKNLDLFRTLPTGTDYNASFQAKFLMAGLNSNARKTVDLDLSSSVKVDESKELLPNYTVLSSSTDAVISSSQNFAITAAAGSMTDISRKYNLSDSKVGIVNKSYSELILVVEGKDVACDLLAKKAVIQATAIAEVIIAPQAFEAMTNLYQSQIAPQLNQVLELKETNAVKAARLGFRLGNIFDRNQNSPESEVVEKQIKTFMEKTFKEGSLETTSEMTYTNDNNKKYFNITGRQGSSVGVSFSM